MNLNEKKGDEEFYPSYMFTRIVEIYSSYISSLEFDYNSKDGIFLLIEQNLPFILSQSIKILYFNHVVYIPFYLGDSLSTRDEYISYDSSPFFKIGDPTSSCPKDCHPSRYVKLELNESSLEEIKMLQEACSHYEKSLKDSRILLSEIKKIFSQWDKGESLTDLTTEDPKIRGFLQQAMSSLKEKELGLFAKDNSKSMLSYKEEEISFLFDFIKEDLLAKSGLSYSSLWGYSSSQEKDSLFENNTKFTSLRNTLVRPLINEMLDKLHLEGHWNFKIDILQKREREIIDEKYQLEIIERYLNLIKKARENGLITLAQEMGKQLSQYLNSSYKEAILWDMGLLNKKAFERSKK